MYLYVRENKSKYLVKLLIINIISITYVLPIYIYKLKVLKKLIIYIVQSYE